MRNVDNFDKYFTAPASCAYPKLALFAIFLRVIVLKAKWRTFERVKVMQSIQSAVASRDLRQSSQSSIPQRVTNWVARLFGCWHREMSRPFSHYGQAYRVCLHCGAQRKFNLSNWTMHGAFYYNRPTSQMTSNRRNRIRLVARAN